MNFRAFAIATAFALLAVASLAMYAKQLRAEISGGEKVPVLVMSKGAKRGTALSEDDLALREIPAAYVDDRVVRAVDKAKILGLKLEHAVDAQQVLEWQDLALSGHTDRTLAALVSPGSRGLTLHIPAQYMSVELIRPGDYVDLIGVVDEKRGTTESIVLMQKVLVLAVGVETTPAHEIAKSTSREDQLLTVSVSLQDSQLIALAIQKGPVIAVVRSPEDPSVATKVPTMSRVTLREPAPATSAAPVASSRPTKIHPPDVY